MPNATRKRGRFSGIPNPGWRKLKQGHQPADLALERWEGADSQAAKAYVIDLYAVEEITNVGLEEIDLDGGTWKITVGFTRPFKQLLMDDASGRVEAVKDRVLVFAQDY